MKTNHFFPTAILGNQRKLPYQMPVVNEHQTFDSSRNETQFINRYMRSYKGSRKSEASSPDLIWSVSDMFLCLESLGANIARDLAPYDRISYSESSFDRVSRILKKKSVFLQITFFVNPLKKKNLFFNIAVV